jgi:hypothetical protein
VTVRGRLSEDNLSGVAFHIAATIGEIAGCFAFGGLGLPAETARRPSRRRLVVRHGLAG